MDSNQLLHYLRGFFELVDEPTPAQIRAIRNEVLRAQPVTASRPMHGDCGGCGGGAPPPPYINREKIPS